MNEANNQRFHDLTFSLMDDGTVKLTQTDCGEDYIITAHPEQIVFIARRLCGMSSETAAKARDLERKLAVITDRLERLVTDKWFRDGIINECGDGIEMIARLDGLVDLCVEMDGGRLLPNEPELETKSENKERLAEPSVTGSLATQEFTHKPERPQPSIVQLDMLI